MLEPSDRVPSSGARTKMLVAGVALLGIFGFFFLKVLDSGVGTMQYYHTLSEFKTSAAVGDVDGLIRLNGFVEAGTIQKDIDNITIDFVMGDGHTTLPVRLHRWDVSDLFKDGANVVVSGRMGEAGVFQADELQAKCPTKYEAEGAEHPEDVPRG